jgi:O-antigen ligase
MIKNNSINLLSENKLDIFIIICLGFLPLLIISRSAIINMVTLLISLTFLFNLKKKNEFFFILKDKIFYYILFFWLSLFINLIYSTNIDESFARVFGFGKWIAIIFLIKYYISFKEFRFETLIYKLWFLTFILVTFDLAFEYIFGFNMLGFQSPMPGRLSSFLDQELKIGNFYTAFLLIALSYFFKNWNKNYMFYLICISFIIISFAIGERSNFLKALLIFVIFLLLIDKNKFIYKIIAFLTIVVSIFVLVTFNTVYKNRSLAQLTMLKNDGIFSYVKNSPYGAHYETAISIFKNYPAFGVGIKNFRSESKKELYENKHVAFNLSRVSTHPHQIHFEFLAETGVFGYLSFLLFFVLSIGLSIKSFLKSRNIYQLSAILFCISSLLPIIPSGSFFTTYSAAIFWTLFGVMISYNKKS